MVKRILWILLDVAVAALILLGVWVINFKIPQKGVRAVNMAEEDTAGNDSGSSGLQNSGGTGSSSDTGNGMNGTELKQTRKVLSTQDWHEKFADKFTDTVVSTDTSYTSPNLSIQISHHQYDSGTVDNTHGGSYAKYGSKISYVLADIYIGDITCFQTAFAQDTYGIGYTEKLTDMSARMKSILSVNGDSYSNNRHRENGTIIRNGVIYRSQQSGEETCVLNWDGEPWIFISRGSWMSRNSSAEVLIRAGSLGQVCWTQMERRMINSGPGLTSAGLIRGLPSGILNRDITACFLWTGDSRAPGECSWMRWRRCLRILAARWLIILTAAIVLLWK